MISAPHKFVKCAACVLLAAFSISVSHASDKAMLDAFVAKGLLTPQEASVLAKESAEVVRSVESTKSLKLSARFQLQYEWIDAESYNPFRDYACSQGFIVRRFFIQADADLGGAWDARVSVDMARSRMNSILTDTYVSKKIDALDGRIFLGYMKPGFSVEDMFSSFGLNAIERSAATMYWTGAANNRRLGVGNRYMGVRWNGDIGGGLSYMLAITNAYQLSPTELDELSYQYTDNHFAYWASVHYKTSGDDWSFKTGVYTAYSSDANYNMGATGSASILSLNPYFVAECGGLRLWGDFLASGVADGKKVGGNYTQANPYGLNFSVEYRFAAGEFGEIAPTFRYSWVNTDGRGLRIVDAQRQSKNIGKLYNSVQEFYVGLNWYLRGDNLKFQLGYDYLQYSGGGFADSSSIRVQMQMKL